MFNTNNNDKNISVLIIGVTGKTGAACLRLLSQHKSNPSIQALVRNPSKLSASERAQFESITQGDARDLGDIERALSTSKATDVIVAVGNGDNVKKSDIRGANARALATILKKPAYRDVRVMVVSSSGAGDSIIKVGMGIGSLISFHLRHVLKVSWIGS